jgi:hypothetical protein
MEAKALTKAFHQRGGQWPQIASCLSWMAVVLMWPMDGNSQNPIQNEGQGFSAAESSALKRWCQNSKRRPAIYQPREDVLYKPGQASGGSSVRSPYASGHEPLEIKTEEIVIPIELPLGAYIKTDAYNAPLERTNIIPGVIGFDASGQPLWNGRPLHSAQSDEAKALSQWCEQFQ